MDSKGCDIRLMPTIDKKKVGERIHKIRINLTSKKMSLESFGKLLNPPSDKSSVRKWEQGMNLPNNERLKQIAELGNVSTDYLLFGKQINGYGQIIKDIRIDLGLSKKDFGALFNTEVSESDVENWEDENVIPSLTELETIAEHGEISPMEILFGKRKYNSMFNPYIFLESSERRLDNSNLSEQERLDSDIFLERANYLRMSQLDKPDQFNQLNKILDFLVYFYCINGETDKETYQDMIKKSQILLEQFAENTYKNNSKLD